MSLAFKEIRVYFRVILGLMVLGAIGLLFFKNSGYAVPIWFFGLTETDKPVNVIWIILCSAAGTLVTWWLLALCWGLWHELRELKHERLLHNATKSLQRRNTELEMRERRIDDKIEKALRIEEPEQTETD